MNTHSAFTQIEKPRLQVFTDGDTSSREIAGPTYVCAFVYFPEDRTSFSLPHSQDLASFQSRAALGSVIVRTASYESNTARIRDSADLTLSFWETLKARQQRARQLQTARAIRLLDAWMQSPDQSEEEHRETLAYLRQALDEDRSSFRKLFP